MDQQSTAVVPSHEIVSFVSIGDSKEPETVRKVIFKKDELERIRTLNLSKGTLSQSAFLQNLHATSDPLDCTEKLT